MRTSRRSRWLVVTAGVGASLLGGAVVAGTTGAGALPDSDGANSVWTLELEPIPACVELGDACGVVRDTSPDVAGGGGGPSPVVPTSPVAGPERPEGPPEPAVVLGERLEPHAGRDPVLPVAPRFAG